MRRYELMLVLRPDVPDERAQAVLDRATRHVIASGGQIIKVAPWGRRRLAYQIGAFREGSYQIVVFEAPADAILELERTLLISEDVIRHLVTRVERPTRKGGHDDAEGTEPEDLPPDDEEPIVEGEQIDESETEAAPAATD